MSRLIKSLSSLWYDSTDKKELLRKFEVKSWGMVYPVSLWGLNKSPSPELTRMYKLASSLVGDYIKSEIEDHSLTILLKISSHSHFACENFNVRVLRLLSCTPEEAAEKIIIEKDRYDKLFLEDILKNGSLSAYTLSLDIRNTKGTVEAYLKLKEKSND